MLTIGSGTDPISSDVHLLLVLVGGGALQKCLVTVHFAVSHFAVSHYLTLTLTLTLSLTLILYPNPDPNP